MGLTRVIGHPCPDCGCEDSQVIGTSHWFGDLIERRQCAACGRQFRTVGQQDDTDQDSADEIAVVEWKTTRCPRCNQRDPTVTSSPKPRRGMPRVRYHHCQRCDHAFKSVESPD